MSDFIEYINQAQKLAEAGYLVTFGIKPTKPETGYGYIEAGESLDTGYKVKRFHEKPSLEKAKEYLNKGNFYWNSGMFAFTVGSILEEFMQHCEDIYKMIENRTYENLGERYRIKRITVYPGESLSLQMHHHRSEHWIVVKGTAKVVLEEGG